MNKDIKINKQIRVEDKGYYSPQKINKNYLIMSKKKEKIINGKRKIFSYNKCKTDFINLKGSYSNIDIRKKIFNNDVSFNQSALLNKKIINSSQINKIPHFKKVYNYRNLFIQINKRKPCLIKIDLTKLDEKRIINRNQENINKTEKNTDSNNNNQSLEEIKIKTTKNEPFKSFAFVEYQNKKRREKIENFHDFKNLSFDNFIVYYFSMFDGHNGEDVALYLKNNFHKVLSRELKQIVFSKEPQKNKEKIITSLRNTFEELDNYIINDKNINEKVGSTGTIILLYRDPLEFSNIYLICANIGDSKGILLTKDNIKQITEDHNCYNEIEIERIKKNQGLFFLGKIFRSLNITRSFGDKEMKPYGIISTPYCFYSLINEKDLYAIVCSDGFWNICKKEDIFKTSINYLSSEEFAKKIVLQAIEKGTNDNISCLVIKLNTKVTLLNN